MELRKTALNEAHKESKGKMIDFFGWELPVEYSGLSNEHTYVRTKAGLFDVSHMGEVIVEGSEALKFVDYLVTNNAAKLVENQVMYTFMCNENGGVVDDLLVYKYTDEKVLLVVNAANLEKDYKWIEKVAKKFDVVTKNISDEVSQIAIQGPKAQEILQKLVEFPLDEVGFFKFKDGAMVDGRSCIVSRTGYTGEDGFEIYTDNENAPHIWRAILKVGEEDIVPAGLGARDTLRFEAGLPLYGNELSETITPIEAGFGFFVKTDKDSFIGKDILKVQKEEGITRKISGFKLLGKGIARGGYKVFANGEEIGHITTGYQLPNCKESIGLALIKKEFSKLGSKVEIQVRKKFVEAEIISKKFLEKNYKK